MLIRKKRWRDKLTLVFERTPFEPSIQTYSAMTLPFWSSFAKRWTWREEHDQLALSSGSLLEEKLTFATLEITAESACRVPVSH
jgi:hypothetical protein